MTLWSNFYVHFRRQQPRSISSVTWGLALYVNLDLLEKIVTQQHNAIKDNYVHIIQFFFLNIIIFNVGLYCFLARERILVRTDLNSINIVLLNSIAELIVIRNLGFLK